MDNESELKRMRELDISDNDEDKHIDKVAKKNVLNGSIIFIAGADFVVIASDNHLVTDLGIVRKHFKLFPMTPQSIIGSVGAWGDVLSMTSLIRNRVQVYEQDNRKTISTEALASMISVFMYSRQLHPCLKSTVLAGLNNEGKGAIFHFDQIGCCMRCHYRILGGACDIMLPNLMHSIGQTDRMPLNEERASDIARDCFTNASRLRTDVGDTVMIQIINKDGVQKKILELR